MKKNTFFSNWKTSVIVFATALLVNLSFAQTNYTVEYLDEVFSIPENIQTFEWNQLPEASRLGNGYIGWVQFYSTPTQDVQDAFKASSIELMEYIPHHTYLVYFPENTSISYLQANGVRAIVPVEGRFKLSENLKNNAIGEWAQVGDRILVTLQYHERVAVDFVLSDLADKQIALVQSYKGSSTLDLSIPNNCLEELSNLSYVKWVEVVVAPDVKDDTRGRSLHRSSGLDTQGAGRNYTGAGVGVMVRDDGIVGPHIDFEGRIDNSMASGTGQTHGDGVGGIMAGAGNLDPSMRGMAAGSDVYIVNYASNFLDGPTQNYINNGDVQITNSSYSNGCNDGYTSITQTVDQQTNDIPSLLHVFSAGNSNNNNCGYGAGNQWGNITGGHKQGKNVIATANVFFDGSLVGSSSRGPAHDGRIKPDIAANGQNQNSTNENNGYLVFGGTSGAAPGIAGISAQLYEAYGDLNAGAFPPSALIKATLLNTANDYGNVGPDYKFGWGIVNALRAGILIEEERHLTDAVSQGGSNTHTITVPTGTTQARFMVYWSDPAAAPNANPSLVNDLDLVVTDPSSNSLLPWILDPTPNPTTLDLPATNGEDHLNNVEQVLINSPAAGDYDIEISGFNVPMGPQEYFVVYEFIQENLKITYPNAGEKFVPGEQESLHWDAVNTTDDFTLEYSTDNGGTWNAITTVDSDETNYAWSVPSSITGEAKIRITSGAFSDESDGTFSIASVVSGVDLAQLCPTQASFAWDAVANAENYDLYILGQNYMEVVGNSTTNSISIPITDPNDEIWYAVVAKNDTEGWESRRSIAVNHSGGLVNCSLANDLALQAINNNPGDFSSACGGGDTIISVTIRNTGIDPQSNFTVSYQVTGQPLVEETFTGTINSGQQEVFDFTTPVSIASNGSYTLTTNVSLAGDQNTSNDENTLDFFAQIDATAIPFEEPFDVNGMPPNAWVIENPDNNFTWTERSGITGSDGNPTVTASIDNYNNNNQGQEDRIVTEIFELSGVANATLRFDLAKAQYSAAFSDALRVEISTDCGATYTTVYEKDALDLSTLPGYNTTNNWAPSAATDWRQEEIDLVPFQGESIVVRFININGYGNSTLIDNININALLGTGDNTLSQFALYPNPASQKVTLEVNTPMEVSNVVIQNSLGQTISTPITANLLNTGKASIDVSSFSAGLYFISVTAGSDTITKKLIIQ